MLQFLRPVLTHLRHRSSGAARVATKFHRSALYGFDLVLWSRLFGKKRGPVPIELTRRLLESKKVRHKPPRLHLDASPELADRWEEGFAAVYATLFLNLQNPDVLSPLRYAHPAPAFKGVYLWDSAFIAQIWKWWDADTARELLDAVLNLRDGERLQHVVSDLVSSAYTQPPLIAWSLFEIENASLPSFTKHFDLRETYEILSRYNEWLYRERRHESGLFFWQHPYESGVENSPRFGNRTESDLVDTREFASPDLSAYVVLQNETLAAIATKLGRSERAAFHRQRAAVLRRLTNEHLWSEDDAIYYDRRFKNGQFLRYRTIASLLPLWAGIPDEHRARRLRDHAMNPHSFATTLPLPSVARDDPSFELDMWRGPVWLNTAYGTLCGLRRYGFHREAATLGWSLCDGVYATHAQTRRLFEFYEPDQPGIQNLNRKLGNHWKKWTLGNKPRPEFVGWSGLVNTIIIEFLFGLQCHENQPPVLTPRFPPQTANQGFSLRLPAIELALHIDVRDASGRIAGSARRKDRLHNFEAEFNEPVPLEPLYNPS